jgi:hypothetical protein
MFENIFLNEFSFDFCENLLIEPTTVVTLTGLPESDDDDDFVMQITKSRVFAMKRG